MGVAQTEMEKPKPRQKTQPAKRAALAEKIFIRLYSPGHGRTAEHLATQALEAADAFLKTAVEYEPKPEPEAEPEAEPTPEAEPEEEPPI